MAEPDLVSPTENGTITHPLDPLSAEEIAAAVQVLRKAGRLADSGRVIDVSLQEPGKAEALSYRPGRPLHRQASAVVLDPATGVTGEAVVDLGAQAVVAWRELRDVRPSITSGEFAECQRVVRADPGFRAALARRGDLDPEQVVVQAWGIGGFARPEDAGRRLAWTLCFLRERPGDLNPYAKPVNGLHAIVDLNLMQVVRVEDFGVTPIPPGDGAYTGMPPREGLRPVEISQPEGPSFTVDGREIRWQNWRLRAGWTQREGLVLHTVSYTDAGRDRLILYRASVAELVIPYADPRPGHAWRNAFDEGEYGLGVLANSLERGCDCLGEIRYLDAEMVTSAGEPYTVPRAVCLHEEDAGLAWKHTDSSDGGHAEVRRSRRLVVSFIITAGNYEYAFYWYFYLDGTIEAEVKLTGIVLTTALGPGETSEYGTVVAERTLAANHQHFFSFRLDMAVDGLANSVHEVNTVATPAGDANPHGNAFTARRTHFRSEQDAQRVIDPLADRYWVITNPGVRNGLGEPVGYKLTPERNVLPFASPESSVIRRAGYMTRHLWVTPYHPDERFAAGKYPHQHPGGDGLPAWTAANRPIENTDIVVWYTLGSNHIPRPEDWPVMPVEHARFTLKPTGFFDRNPALDIPPPPGSCHP